MDVSNTQGAAAAGMLTKALQTQALEGSLINKTLEAQEQMKTTMNQNNQFQQTMELQNSVLAAKGIGKSINTVI